MIPQAHRQEMLQSAYVAAVAAQAGIKAEFSAGTEYGVDGRFELVTELVTLRGDRLLCETGYSLDFQLKSTTNCRTIKRSPEGREDLSYRCEAATYNKLVLRNALGTAPILLLVLCLPENPSEWLNVTPAALALQGACYWHFVRETQTISGSSLALRIDRSWLFTPDSLKGIMNEVQERGGRP